MSNSSSSSKTRKSHLDMRTDQACLACIYDDIWVLHSSSPPSLCSMPCTLMECRSSQSSTNLHLFRSTTVRLGYHLPAGFELRYILLSLSVKVVTDAGSGPPSWPESLVLLQLGLPIPDLQLRSRESWLEHLARPGSTAPFGALRVLYHQRFVRCHSRRRADGDDPSHCQCSRKSP